MSDPGRPPPRCHAGDAVRAQASERAWQRARLPAAVRDLVLDDQRRRSAICWHVFDE